MRRKYELVGCKRQQEFFGKTEYLEEEVIKIPGQTLEHLLEIDRFTYSYGVTDFLAKLPIEYQEKNHFSIRYWNAKEGKWNYLEALFAHPELQEVLMGVHKCERFTYGKRQTVEVVPYQQEVVYGLWSTIKECLENKNVDHLEKLVNPHTAFGKRLFTYFEHCYDEGGEVMEQRFLQERFCNYKTFRQVYINTFKKRKVQNLKVYAKAMKAEPKYIGGYKTIDQEPIFDDKEEFLTRDEIDQAVGCENDLYGVTYRKVYHV